MNPADFDVVLTRWLRDIERIAPDRLLLTFAPAATLTLCALADQVPHGVTVDVEDGQVLVEITLPGEGDDLLDELVIRAETADLRALQRHLAA
ncbi:MAG: hypothetical protein ABS81_07095 [Pseudonocardia sp. SCN 72-86]|nr:MAG: hypothetical protein ABS81_07095 [Pseudonocardia sp. SCN 72-86]